MTIFVIIFCAALLAFSLRFTWWVWPKKNGLLALMYHNIETAPEDTDEKERPFFISPQVFERQLDTLLKHGFTPITFEDLTAAYLGKSALPKKPVLITIDDGALNAYTNAFTVLKKKNVKANIFLITEKIGRDKNFLTWEQVLEMQKSGFVGFGSHTANHKRLRSISDEEILSELTKSKQTLEEKLGVNITAFCYPYGAGAFDRRVRPLVFKAGYLFDFSTKKGISTWPLNGKAIRRAPVKSGQTAFDFYLQITRGMSKL